MGSGASRHAESLEAAEHQRLEKYLSEERDKVESTVKILLLGIAECGKSTILKQMRILHAEGFGMDERRQQKFVIHHNVLVNMNKILNGMSSFNINFESPNRIDDAVLVMKWLVSDEAGMQISPRMSLAVQSLWEDGGVRKACNFGHLFNLPDSAQYFFNHIIRISKPDYLPTDDDVLRARVKTTGVVETRFVSRETHFLVVDVGGQRGERRKWLRCFDGVNALLYLAAISEFDQVIEEDMRTNRMHETMRLFDFVANSRYFRKTSLILFLNKIDLFKEKLAKVSFSCHFKDFRGDPESFEDTSGFLKDWLVKGVRHGKKVYSHRTCATDTNQVRFIIASCIDMVVEKNLRNNGFS